MATRPATLLHLLEGTDPFPQSTKSHLKFYTTLLRKLAAIPAVRADDTTMHAWAAAHVLVLRLQQLAEEKRKSAKSDGGTTSSSADTSAVDAETTLLIEALNALARREVLITIDPAREGLSPPDDPEGGLGFYAAQSPLLTRTGDECRFYVPCCASGFTRPFFGVAFTLLTALFRESRRTPSEGRLREILAAVEATTRKIRSRLRKMASPEAKRLADALAVEVSQHKTNTRARRALPIWPMLDSQVFYEEGIRFYDRENEVAKANRTPAHVYISATSSGLLQPPEFYGFPYIEGISTRCPPEVFSAESIMADSPEYQQWDEECCESIRARLPELLANPQPAANLFRPVYFANGIAKPHPHVVKHYFVLGAERQAGEIPIAQKEDREVLRRYFRGKVLLHLIPSSKLAENDWLRYYTLFGEQTLLMSSRLRGPQISHGWWYDLDLIRKYDRHIEKLSQTAGRPKPPADIARTVAKEIIKLVPPGALGGGIGLGIAAYKVSVELAGACLPHLCEFVRSRIPKQGEYRRRVEELARDHPAVEIR